MTVVLPLSALAIVALLSVSQLAHYYYYYYYYYCKYNIYVLASQYVLLLRIVSANPKCSATYIQYVNSYLHLL
jgi:hypothetical protein